MRIHHLNAATLCPMSARLVNGRGCLFGRATLVCHVLLVETRHGLVLVDTGLGLGDVADPARLGPAWVRQVAPRLISEEAASTQVKELGFSPDDVRDIVLTHLDLDHAGGIADFPRARVHVHAREHHAALHGEGTRAGLRYIADHWSHQPRWSLFEDGGERWYGFDGVRELAPYAGEILLVPLRGHTYGHTGVAVRGSKKWLLHAGDSYFFHGQMEAPPRAPFVLEMFQRRSDMDRAARVLNQERVRMLAVTHGAEVTPFCAHDAVELARMQGRTTSRVGRALRASASA